MKILHVSRAIGEFSYHESIIRHLCARGHDVHALFDPGYIQQGSDQALQKCVAEAPTFSFDWSVRPHSWQRRAAVALHELNTFASFLVRSDQSQHYLATWEQRMPKKLRLMVRPPPVRAAMRSAMVQRTMRRLSHGLRPDPAVVRLLRELRPDVVVASPTNMRFSYEAAYVHAAKALGIRTVVPVFSWDNLTNKGIYPVLPDLVLAWNDRHAREAIAIHGVPPERVLVTGSPFFDKWFSSMHQREGREEFCRKVGLDPESPFLCYLGSTDNVAPNESWLVREIADALGTHPDPVIRSIQVLVRPHPRNAKIFEAITQPRIRVWPRAGALPDSTETLGDFSASLGYAVAAVGVNTTGMLDAIVADAPVITVLADRYQKTQSATSHFKHLLDAEVLDVVQDSQAVLGRIERLLAGEDDTREARRAFVHEFIRPHGLDTAAGEIAARVIETGKLEQQPWRTAA